MHDWHAFPATLFQRIVAAHNIDPKPPEFDRCGQRKLVFVLVSC
jgi:hypothetical protein